MDNKGKITLTTIVIALLAMAVVYFAIIRPVMAKGESGINIYILDKDMKPMAMLNPGTTYQMLSTTLGITYNGKTVGGLGFTLWVKPTADGTPSGKVNIAYAGFREIVGTMFSSQYCSGSVDVAWGTATELKWDQMTDSWIQITSATFSFLDPSTYTANIRYDVTAKGTVDGVQRTATASPSTTVSLTYTAGTLSITAGVNIYELTIKK